MGTTYCDKCHFEWQISEDEIQTIEFDEKSGTKMRFFQCPECSAEYVIDVTDREIRKQISIFKKMQRKYKRMYEAHESEVRLHNYLEKLDAKKHELLNRQNELRRKWTGGK